MKDMRVTLGVEPLDGNEKTPNFIEEMEVFLEDPYKYLELWLAFS